MSDIFVLGKSDVSGACAIENELSITRAITALIKIRKSYKKFYSLSRYFL